jgi:putative ABC transport system permease protein
LYIIFREEFKMKVPLAWRQISYEKMRLIIAIAGIAFADLLMFMQLGFRDALLQSSMRLHERLKGDIFMISSQTDSIVATQTFSQRRLYEALGVKGIKSVNPFYVSLAPFKNPDTGADRTIFVFAFNPNQDLVNLQGVEENKHFLLLEDTYLFDQKSRKDFGPVATYINQGKNVKTELNRRQITIRGLFTLGSSFGADGNVITSDINFFRLFKNREKGLIDIGIIQLEPDANVEEVLKMLKEKLPKDVQVFSKQGFLDYEKSYWVNRTAIGFVFTLGTVMGFIVGTVIVYQILYSNVADHLPEYATMKAMGYGDLYFLFVVFQQSVILGLVGFFPGMLVSRLLYIFTANSTGLPIAMTLYRAISVLILTLIMCCISGSIAMKKLSDADPADIF